MLILLPQPMFVKEFGLFSTTFRRVDGQEIIAPNSLLSSSKLVHNLRRSNSMWETTEIQIAYDTPLEVIEKLRQSLATYIQENSREWSNTNMNIDTIQNQNVIHLVIGVERTSSLYNHSSYADPTSLQIARTGKTGAPAGDAGTCS